MIDCNDRDIQGYEFALRVRSNKFIARTEFEMHQISSTFLNPRRLFLWTTMVTLMFAGCGGIGSKLDDEFRESGSASQSCDDGGYSFCSSRCGGPCAKGEGDCDSDRECQAGLNCTPNIGQDFELSASVDDCVDPKPKENCGNRADVPIESKNCSFPYRILYNNDLTNTAGTTSPFHSPETPFTADVLRGTVDEVAGLTDVHLLSPGLGWIPVWDSQIYPAAEHYQRWEQTTGLQADTYGQFLMAGGDMLQIFIDRCRQTGQVPFISFRMNDPHMQEHADDFAAGIYDQRSQWISDFYLAHLDDRLGDDYLTNFRSRGLNWMVPEVREQKYEFLREILENYDIDGVELDFLRWDGYFKTSETTEAEREAVMTAFISRIRTLLDTTAKPGQHRWLGIRVPSYLRTQGNPYMQNYRAMGIDLQAVTAAGVDFVNLSASYPLVQQTDLAEIRLLIPDTAIFFEMTYVTWDPPARGIQLDFFRSTDEQFYTTADLAYRQGANGISLFNFQYFRGNGPNPQSDPQGPFHEPPFHIIPQLRDPEWLANIPQQWYMEGDSSWYRDVPREFYADQPQAMILQLYPSNSLHDADAMFRLFHEEPCSECSWEVEFNGFVLDGTGCLEHPIDNRYVGNDYGDLEQYACFKVPRTLVLEGSNAIVINLNSGGPVWVRYYDLILSPDQWISN